MMVAADLMQPPVSLGLDDDLRTAVEIMVTHALREAPVSDEQGAIVGFVDEAEVGAGLSDGDDAARAPRGRDAAGCAVRA